MKTILAVGIMLAFLAGAGYYGLPLLIERETATLRSDILQLQERVGAVEGYIQEEKDVRAKAQLPPDADVTSIINGLNDASRKLSALEASFQENMGKTEQTFAQMGTATSESFKEESEAIAALKSDVQSRIQKLMLDAAVTAVRTHILKVKVELASQNIGSAKTELDRIVAMLKLAGEYAGEAKESTLKEMTESVQKIKTEVDQDMPVAVNRIDLLWHELSTVHETD